MLGLVFGAATSAASRLFGLALTVAIFLLARPGGWAVLVVLALIGVKLLRAPAG